MSAALISGWLMVAVILGAVDSWLAEETEPATTEAGVDFINTAFGAERIVIDDATFGDNSGSGILGGAIGATWGFVKAPAAMASKLVNALLFNFEFLTGDFAFIKTLLRTATVGLLILVIWQQQAIIFSGVRGLFSRFT